MTIVPDLALTTTLAEGLAGSNSIFSSRLIKATFWDGSIGALTLTDVESIGTETSGPNISLIASATFVAVLKSPWWRLSIKKGFSKNGISTNFSTVAPLGILPTVGILTIREEPSPPSTPNPPTTKLPCAIA